MEQRIAAFIILCTLAGVCLWLASRWGMLLARAELEAQREQANYFGHVWLVMFVVFAVAAVWVLVGMLAALRGRGRGDDVGSG